jgi:GNAT superfamily N-acetyltransferase
MSMAVNTNPLFPAMEANLQQSYEHLAHALGATFQREEGLLSFFTDKPLALCNGVIRFEGSKQEAEKRIEEITREATERQVPMTWLLGLSPRPADLRDRLKAHGWTPDEKVVGMAVELKPTDASERVLPAGMHIAEVSDHETMQTWLDVFCHGFGFPEVVRNIFFGLYHTYGFIGSHPLCYLLGTRDGRPVGTSLLSLRGGLAGVYAVVALPEARKQGVGTAMTQAAMQVASAKGYGVATLQATAMGLNVYRRLGWQEFFPPFETYTFFPKSSQFPT